MQVPERVRRRIENGSADRTHIVPESNTTCTIDHSGVSIDLSRASEIVAARRFALGLQVGSHRPHSKHHIPLRSRSGGVRLGRFGERGGRCGGGRGGGGGGE